MRRRPRSGGSRAASRLNDHSRPVTATARDTRAAGRDARPTPAPPPPPPTVLGPPRDTTPPSPGAPGHDCLTMSTNGGPPSARTPAGPTPGQLRRLDTSLEDGLGQSVHAGAMPSNNRKPMPVTLHPFVPCGLAVWSVARSVPGERADEPCPASPRQAAPSHAKAPPRQAAPCRTRRGSDGP